MRSRPHVPKQVAGACGSIFVAHVGAYNGSAFRVALVLKQNLDFPNCCIGVIAFAWDAPRHANTNEPRSVVRLIMTVVNN
jgi:hypothetical protein